MKQLLTNIINCGYRTYTNIGVLKKVSDIIYSELTKSCDSVMFQDFTINNTSYRNVVGTIKGDLEEKIIIGSHYDVCGDIDGADDNGSAIVGMIETAKSIKTKPKYTLEFVAFCLEEPPYFGTEHMGSYHHAKSLFDNKNKVKVMINYEMIGYYTDTQPYIGVDIGLPTTGNFIAMCGRNTKETDVLNALKKSITTSTKLPLFTSDNPAIENFISLSDNINYWTFGYKAIMVTDTAFIRNPNYHKESDTIDTLDFDRIKLVVDYIGQYITKIS